LYNKDLLTLEAIKKKECDKQVFWMEEFENKFYDIKLIHLKKEEYCIA